MISNDLLDSFKYAITGIKDAYCERNLKIQTCIMVIVIVMGVILKISYVECLVCIILFSLVISAELFNSAIENTVDFIEKNRNGKKEKLGIDENARLAKDISAGAVLVLSIGSAVIGLMIFIPKILFVLGF